MDLILKDEHNLKSSPTCDQQNAGTTSEDSIGHNKDEGHKYPWNTSPVEKNST